MTAAIAFEPGGYSYVPGVFQYSAGVAAMPGYCIERVRFRRPVPLEAGFRHIARAIEAAGRPPTAFCACELRSPEPFSEAGFKAFNEVYVGTLERWGLYRSGANPVARSNVCPETARPDSPAFHAFCFTVESPCADPSFVVAGSAECPEGHGNYRDHIVAFEDLSTDGLRRKAAFVLEEMARRMEILEAGWDATTAVQLYTVHDIHPILADTIAPGGAMANGLSWHYCRPPVVGLELEMDCRRVQAERILDPDGALRP